MHWQREPLGTVREVGTEYAVPTDTGPSYAPWRGTATLTRKFYHSPISASCRGCERASRPYWRRGGPVPRRRAAIRGKESRAWACISAHERPRKVRLSELCKPLLVVVVCCLSCLFFDGKVCRSLSETGAKIYTLVFILPRPFPRPARESGVRGCARQWGEKWHK